MQGNNSNGRTPYTHIAYATNADGTQGFSITDAKGKTYFGYYTDYMAEDSNVASSYTWAPIEGIEDIGIKGLAGKQGIEQESQVEQEQQAPKKQVIPTWAQYTIIILITGFLHLGFLTSLAIGVVLWLVFDLINGDL